MNAVARAATTTARPAAEAARRARRGRPWVLLAPAGFFIGVLACCALAMLRLSFGTKTGEWSDWTVANYVALDQRYYLSSLWTTLRLAFESAIFTIALALPVALFMTRTTSPLLRRVVLVGILIPMLMSVLLQSYGWMVLLGPGGLVNRLLLSLHVTSRPIAFLFNGSGVLIGLVQTCIPLAVLPIASALENVPRAFEEAAAVLGASRWRVYAHVILPLAAPGLLAAFVLVFGFNTGAFVVPLLLGGLRITTMAVLIQDQMGPMLNWPMGAAASVLLIVLALSVQALLTVRPRKAAGA